MASGSALISDRRGRVAVVASAVGTYYVLVKRIRESRMDLHSRLDTHCHARSARQPARREIRERIPRSSFAPDSRAECPTQKETHHALARPHPQHPAKFNSITSKRSSGSSLQPMGSPHTLRASQGHMPFQKQRVIKQNNIGHWTKKRNCDTSPARDGFWFTIWKS